MDMQSCGNFRFHLRNTKVGKGALAFAPHSPFVRPIICPRDDIFGSKKGVLHVRIASVSSKNEKEPPQHFRSGTGRCCHYVEFVPWIINCGLINRDIKKSVTLPNFANSQYNALKPIRDAMGGYDRNHCWSGPNNLFYEDFIITIPNDSEFHPILSPATTIPSDNTRRVDPNGIHTLTLPATVLDGMDSAKIRRFAGMLRKQRVPKTLKLELNGGTCCKLKNMHEDTNFALVLRVREDRRFEKFVGAAPSIIDGLLRFQSGSRIFNPENVAGIAMQIAKDIVQGHEITQEDNLELIARAMQSALSNEFGNIWEVRSHADTEFNATLQSAINQARDIALEIEDRGQRCTIFGYAFGALQAGALRYTGYIQRKQNKFYEVMGQQLGNAINTAILIPTLFTSHLGGVLLTLGVIGAGFEAQVTLTNITKKILPPTLWYEASYSVVVGYLRYLRRYGERNQDLKAYIDMFISAAKDGLESGLPAPLLMHEHFDLINGIKVRN